MITPSRSMASLSALAVVAATAAVGWSGPAGATAAPTRYASPSGSGTTCSPSQPCSIVTAVNQAPGNSQVVVNPGTYGSPQHPITQTLEVEPSGVFVHGIAGKGIPVIHSSADIGFDVRGTLRDVRIDYSGPNQAIFSTGLVSHVMGISTATGGTACYTTTKIVDSLCLATGASGDALGIEMGFGSGPARTFNLTLRGVTAVATDPSGTGLEVDAGGLTTIKVKATDDIIQGGGDDIDTDTSAATATVQIVLSHCDYRSIDNKGSIGQATVTDPHQPTEVLARAQFVSAADGNYREAPGSPTIDMGAIDPARDTDVVNRPRTVGSAADIGAFEFLQPPTLSHIETRTVTGDSVSVSADVNAEGLKSEVRLTASQGHSRLSSPWANARNHRVMRELRLTVTGLSAGVKYAVRLVAKNSGGSTKSPKQSITTN